MRISRAKLLGRLSAPGAPAVVVFEAPTGYGKSWLARRAVDPGALRVRGRVDALPVTLDRPLLVDDAHLLTTDQVADLTELIEQADHHRRVIVAGRLVAPEIHDAAHLVDGATLDAMDLAVTIDELEPATVMSAPAAMQLIVAADGCIRIVAALLDEVIADRTSDPSVLASRMIRAIAISTQQTFTDVERSVLGLLARAPGLEAALLDQLGGPHFVERCLEVGIPLRRQVTGELELLLAAGFRANPILPAGASDLAHELIRRDRPIEAASILLDAGRHERAAELLAELSESVAETIDPRTLLNLLARLGPAAEQEPVLILWRAAAERDLGQIDQAREDIDRAVALASTAPATVRHRVEVEAARARLTEGDVVAAETIVQQALEDLGPGEERTYARAYELLGQCAGMSDRRADLQRAAEYFQVAAAAWDSCGERAKARTTRTDGAMTALIPLGRHDEALAVLGQLLTSPELSSSERSWVTLMEGFALYHANRLDSAAARFDRVIDLGYLYDNPRMTATASWGHALVAWHRNDRDSAVRHLTNAENTALGLDDDILGVPFLCDAATVLGAFGELELAEQRLALAVDRHPVFPDQVRSSRFVLDARRGILGDVAEALELTQPALTWRIHFVAAYASALHGDLANAEALVGEAERELRALGIGDPESQGEARLTAELRALLATGRPAVTAAVRARPETVSADAYVHVIGGEMTVTDDGHQLEGAPGTPRRLVGIVAASGGTATIDQISEALWPGDPVDASRARLRNVLMRLRRATGDLMVRTAAGVRFAPGVRCDLLEFQRQAADALAAARADPDLAGRLADDAVRLADGPVFADFQYDEWAVETRRVVEQHLINLLDLLSVQAEDRGDLAAAQAHAERALRLDRYADSRYVRLSELLAMQDRVAAAIAVLDDAAEVAREMGGELPADVRGRRNDLLRRAARR